MTNPNQLASDGVETPEEDGREAGVTRRRLLLTSLAAVLAAGTTVVLNSCNQEDRPDYSGRTHNRDARRRYAKDKSGWFN